MRTGVPDGAGGFRSLAADRESLAVLNTNCPSLLLATAVLLSFGRSHSSLLRTGMSTPVSARSFKKGIRGLVFSVRARWLF
jgi:hypothetical protein